MPAAERIEPIAMRLGAQCLAAELSTGSHNGAKQSTRRGGPVWQNASSFVLVSQTDAKHIRFGTYEKDDV